MPSTEPRQRVCVVLQIEQFRKKYGIVENVSDRPYVSNSFHCHVTEDMTPIEKQDQGRTGSGSCATAERSSMSVIR